MGKEEDGGGVGEGNWGGGSRGELGRQRQRGAGEGGRGGVEEEGGEGGE